MANNTKTDGGSNAKNQAAQTTNNTDTFLCGTMKSEIMSEARRVLSALGCDASKTVSTEAYYKALAITLVRAMVPEKLITDSKVRSAYVARALVVIETLPKNASAMRQAVYEAKKETTTPDGSDKLADLC